MSEEKYDDLNLIDDMNKHLEEAFTLADLMTHYSPPHEGRTAFGATVENAGIMLENVLFDARDTFEKWRKQKRKSWEAKDATRSTAASLPVY